MLGLVEMFGGVLVERRIAAADMAADQAQAKMNPGTADFEALFATLRLGLHVLNLVQMRALGHSLILSPVLVY
jgi:hypothetical protein